MARRLNESSSRSSLLANSLAHRSTANNVSPQTVGWVSMRSMILIIVGCGVLALGIFLAVREHRWLKAANIVDGTVAEVILSRSSSSSKYGGKSISYRPRFVYRTPEGQHHSFTRNYGSDHYKVGDVVKVAYQPAANDARILTFQERFGGAVILIAIGAAFTLTALGKQFGPHFVPKIYLQQQVSQPSK